jgi:chemotaxis protein CheX
MSERTNSEYSEREDLEDAAGLDGMPTPTDDDLMAIAEQVWASYLDPEGVNPLLLAPPATPPRDVSASVSMTGAWRGHVVVSCSATASRNAAAALLGVDLADVTPADVTDAVGELANIIGGNVKSLLPEPSALSLPIVLIDGSSGWPSVVELCQLDGTWLGEPVAVRVLESSVEKKV